MQPNQVSYLVVILQDDLHWDKQLTNFEKKLSGIEKTQKKLTLLSKIRH